MKDLSQYNQLIINKCFDKDIKSLESLFEAAYMCFSVENLGVVVGFIAISDEPA